MTISTYHVASEAEALAAAEHARRTNGSAPPSSPAQTHGHGKAQVDMHGDGRVVTKNIGNRAVSVDQPLRPGHVIIPGLGETTIEAARIAGLLPPGFEQPVGGQSAAAPAGIEAKGDDTNDAEAIPMDADAEAATTAANSAMDALATTLGGEAVADGIWLAAETGDYVGTTPDGVSGEHVEALVTGFTAQANAVLGAMPLGAASVDMLTETLTNEELREARQATIMNDREKLSHFGKLALNRMESLPYANEAAFSDLIAGMPAAERKALTRDEVTGQWTVTVPGRERMSFAQAVRAGIVRVG